MSWLLRPRSLGELLDDAWRLAVAHTPQLLALTALYLAPGFVALLLLLTSAPRQGAGALGLAVLTASLLPVGGLASGASQHYLQRLLEGAPPSVGASVAASLRRGHRHWMAHAVLLVGILTGLGCLVLPGLTIWMGGVGVHGLIASRERGGRHEPGREARSSPPKAAAITLGRLPLLAVLALNLHLLIAGLLWTASTFLGVETAYLGVQLAWHNPVYVLSLVLFCWMLLAPWAEAASFLLQLDTRIRQEGVDLFYRVQRLFPLPAIAILLTCAASTVSAEDAGQCALRARARQQLEVIQKEIEQASPYAGGAAWTSRLDRVRREVEAGIPAPAGREHWMARALKGFEDLPREEAVQVLGEIRERLAATGPRPSPETIRRLLRPLPDEQEGPRSSREEEQEQAPRIEKDGQPDPRAATPQRGAGTAGRTGQASGRVWLVLAGILVALVVTGWWLLAPKQPHMRRPGPRRAARPQTGEEVAVREPGPHEVPADLLCQEAERLAARGEYLQAVRGLYRAALSHLHRARLLHCGPARTNGEYLAEVRLAPEAAPPLRDAFARLVDLFERKWYGERACGDGEYAAARALVGEVRALAPRA